MEKASYNWNELPWKKAPLVLRSAGYPWQSLRARRRQLSLCFYEDRESCGIRTPRGTGKITDAGYDSLCCVCAPIPSECDFSAEADITVRRFLGEPAPNGQEGFGLFLRENIRRHPRLGVYYSNMAAVGGYLGRFNFFGRGGLERGDIAHVENRVLYRRVDRPGGVYRQEPLRYRIGEDRPLRLHISLRRQGGALFARMTGPDGADLLAPDNNGGPGELSGQAVPGEAPGSYRLELKGAFPPRPGKPVYLGFFAARGTEILIHKDSFRLALLGKERPLPEGGGVPAPAAEETPLPRKAFDASEYPARQGRVYRVSPDGSPSGDGSGEKPLDLYTAIERCGPDEELVLAPGRYLLPRSVVLEKRHSGRPGACKRISGDPDGGTVLDFGGTDGCLSLLGDYWVAENLHVTNGYGIQIEGSCNWLKHCSAFRNLETGILIRHHDNTSDRRDWPCCNLVEDCLSYENRDPSECNADGFACKVAAGTGNRFQNCTAFLNSDDGFDLFTKNREIGSVTLTDCRSCLNGYKRGDGDRLEETKGNGNGFKLGGTGMRIEHSVTRCEAVGNRQYGFTNNSNPFMALTECSARNNGRENIRYAVYEGSRLKRLRRLKACESRDARDFRPELLLEDLTRGLG